MALTLADLAANADTKTAQGFINEIITDNYLLGRLTFDDTVNPNGTGTMEYAYRRIVTHASAKFRALNGTIQASDVKSRRYSSNVAIISDKVTIDRVARANAEDLYAEKLTEIRNSITRKFNATVISGDKTQETNGFDGLSKSLAGSSTEFTSQVNLSDGITQAEAFSFADEMDDMLGALMRTPDVLLVSQAMLNRIRSIKRAIGMYQASAEGGMTAMDNWGGIPIQAQRDGSMTGNMDVYALCLGLDGFHGITLTGGNAISLYLPDWSKPGPSKDIEAELVAGVVLKATKAAGVLHPFGTAASGD